ncbi:1,6-anhydro-N-acetylmuramyl-L-alanine amidase AmpD [uncultured Salinisphaera sp.]|uniref:1,6-anhydro-N-acetylmuramyl-L-alanine amidase AmpD n=1 Tax=uncultured Salinisphaera sp. TaxID=359372 RepID=UPI0032B179B5|tara:strand:- start:12443 stop:13003 length:561 start_codon:yes stop_codon:yes gene_type:complete
MALTVDDSGWLVEARRRASPNYDARPSGTPIDALVVHGMTVPPGMFGHGHIEALFTNTLDARRNALFAALAEIRVSAHAVIERTGRLTQYVGFDQRAWHAGVSNLAGRERVNDFSIGIELEGTDDCVYTPAQYRVLITLVRCLQAHYPAITRARIIGHEDIAPARKTDPGPAFDWAALFAGLTRGG